MAKNYVLGSGAVRAIDELLNGSGEVSRRKAATPGLVVPDEYVAPFTVQWAQSANSGAGSWIIWLPGPIVMYGAATRNPATGLEAVGGDYPDGWYILTDNQLDRSSGGILYLYVDGRSAIPFRAEFYSRPVAQTTAGDVSAISGYYNIPICAATVAENGERTVKQYVRSTLMVGSAVEAQIYEVSSDNPDGSGDSGGAAIVSTEWLKKNGVISVNGLQGKIAVIGGKYINVSTSGNSIVISLDSEKDYEDENPYPPTTDECPHPGGGYGYGDESDPDSDLPGGGGVYGENGTESQSGVTDDCCGGASAVASGTGYPTEGASGYPVDGDGYPTTGGKPATGGSSQGGVPASSGLFNGSTIPRTTIEDVQGGAHSMLGPSGGTTIEDVQGGTHSMNQSPFVSGGSATTIESSQDNIHTMNQSPFKKGSQ